MKTGLDAETRALIGDTLNRLVDDVYQPAARLARIKASSIDYRLHWPLLAEVGLLGLSYDEPLGGMGASAVDIAHAIRTLARGLVLEPFVDSAIIAGSLLAAGADAVARSHAVAGAISGQSISIVVDLSGDPDAPNLHQTGNGLELHGIARVVPYAAQADEWLVVARDAGSDETCVVRVLRTQPGATLSQVRLMDATPASDIRFDAAALELSQVWLRGAAADLALARASDLALLVHAADALGGMERLLAMTGDYLRTRVQFGVALGSFQALQHRFADMQMDMLEVRALVRSYAQYLDGVPRGTPKSELQSALARRTPRAAQNIGHEAIQMHGGMGVTEELVVGHYNAHLQVLRGRINGWRHTRASVQAEAT